MPNCAPNFDFALGSVYSDSPFFLSMSLLLFGGTSTIYLKTKVNGEIIYLTIPYGCRVPPQTEQLSTG